MHACKRHRLLRSLPLAVAALAATACTIQVPSDESSDPNTRVDEVVVVGTSVTSALYTTGEIGLTTVPKDSRDQVVLGKGLKVEVVLTSPTATTVDVAGTECTEPEQGKRAIAVGVIIDDSGSMGSSDPKVLRKEATKSFLNTLGVEDKVLLTDYGAGGKPLRDLLCVSQGGATSDCTPPKASFTTDRAALLQATEQIKSMGSTPLYESCSQMVPLVDTVTDMRRGILLLSDGKPTDDDKRDACHTVAKAAQLPVFTVGLGPAAEGDPNVDTDAVKVLRELSTDTGGSYASANDAAELDQLFRNMGTALTRGSCRTSATIREAAAKIAPGTKVTGEIRIGNNGAKAGFEFVAPKN
jgi:von Willebrand factor type A domain-containing protein